MCNKGVSRALCGIAFQSVFRPVELKRKRRRGQGGENIADNSKRNNISTIFSPDPLTSLGVSVLVAPVERQISKTE